MEVSPKSALFMNESSKNQSFKKRITNFFLRAVTYLLVTVTNDYMFFFDNAIDILGLWGP